MLANRLQFEAAQQSIFDPCQFGGVRQHSTEDAGVFLTHLIRAGWKSGLKTSVVAFDLAQFFPSLNHGMLVGILRKLGFAPQVVTFFNSYLVNRSTSYVWNLDSSPRFNADVGVGQGSALSPVLSALYLVPMMRIFEARRFMTHSAVLMSYVDDGTIIVQSQTLEENLPKLQEAYAVINELTSRLGLILEHDKSEAFHFTRNPKDPDLPVDLGFAPYTGSSPLAPKSVWRYLGFYFDRTLRFHEHVRYYSTKALTTARAMVLLGNSSRGLHFDQKRLLYRSCVVPIATYGCRLWYFKGSRHRTSLKLLSSMQRTAALWILGAFRTSPGGGVESLAGLPPIHLHIKKLVTRANYNSKTLLETHPTRSLLWSAVDPPYSLCLRKMQPSALRGLLSPVIDIDAAFEQISESFEAFHPESQPGRRLKDIYSSQISYSLAPWPTDPDERDKTARRITQLRSDALSVPGTFVVSGDGAASGATQAVAACNVESANVRRWEARMAIGKANSLNAELLALAMGVQHACKNPGCSRILVFTDSTGAANLLLNADPHSGQSHSIATCRLLREWLSSDPSHSIAFHYVSSKAKWGPHHQAHLSARELKVSFGSYPKATLEWYRQQAVRSMLDSWTSRFADPSYRGSHFLSLEAGYGSAW